MDIDILLALQSARGAFADAVFNLITLLGGEIPLMALICLTYWCVNKRLGTRLILTFFVSLLANQFLKLAFRTPRPWVRDARVTPSARAIDGATGYSFPSGHTANAVASYGTLARSAQKGAQKWALWLLAMLIGFSRMVLGVHTIQDVLVSFALGVLLVFLIERLTAFMDARPRADVWIAAVGVGLSACLVAFALFACGEDVEISLDAFKFAGGALGVMLGWLLDRRTLGFQVSGGALKKAARLIAGMALVLIVLIGLKSPLNALFGARAGGYARYALLGVTATYLWPLAFTKFRL